MSSQINLSFTIWSEHPSWPAGSQHGFLHLQSFHSLHKDIKRSPLLLLPTDIKLILQCSWPALLSKKTERFQRGLFSGFLAFYNEMNKSDKIYFCNVILFDKKSLTQLEIDNRDIYCWWCFISCANKNLLQHELYALQKGLFECLCYLCRERCSFRT